MVNKKTIRTRGKLKLSQYFQKLKEGDFVAISKEYSVPSYFLKRLQGVTGIVEKRRGKSYIIKIKDGKKIKKLLIESIHLKKIKRTN